MLVNYKHNGTDSTWTTAKIESEKKKRRICECTIIIKLQMMDRPQGTLHVRAYNNPPSAHPNGTWMGLWAIHTALPHHFCGYISLFASMFHSQPNRPARPNHISFCVVHSIIDFFFLSLLIFYNQMILSSSQSRICNDRNPFLSLSLSIEINLFLDKIVWPS